MAGVKEVGGKEKPALAPRQRGGKGGTCRRGDDTVHIRAIETTFCGLASGFLKCIHLISGIKKTSC